MVKIEFSGTVMLMLNATHTHTLLPKSIQNLLFLFYNIKKKKSYTEAGDQLPGLKAVPCFNHLGLS